MTRLLVRWLGRSRARALLGWLAFLALTTAAAAGVVAGMPHALPLLAERGIVLTPEQAAAVPVAALWLLLVVIAYVVWRLAVRNPQRRLRHRLRTRSLRRRTLDSAHVRELSTQMERRSDQLKAALQLNRTIRTKLDHLSAAQQTILRSREALLTMTQDAMLLTDAQGTIIGASTATGVMMRRSRESLVGTRFDDSASLYAAGGALTPARLLRGMIQRVVAMGSTVPVIEQGVLLDAQNEQIPVLITAAAVLDSGGAVLGTLVRINRNTAQGEGTAQAKPELSLAEVGMNDWGTNLLSREPCERRIDELVGDAKTRGRRHAMLFVRLDDLGRVNDEHGFWAGEQVLWHAARNFAAALGGAGVGYRYSNSRFVALLQECDAAKATELAERLRLHAQHHELLWEGRRIPCTFSLAVVVIDGSEDRNNLIAAAETLLGEARNRGGNSVLQQVPTETVKQRKRDDQLWLDWIVPRLADGRAHLISQIMQPLNPDSGAPLIETYVRVEDDDGVWLEPGYYMPALERLRQSHLVDLWVLREMLKTLEQNPRLFDTHAAASINLASGSLLNPDFATQVFDIVGASSVPPQRLCFEIEEAFAISQSAVVQRFMDQLRMIGVHFALDRCHTTMGITHLRQLPVDYMKIHPRVTRDIERDALDRTHLEWICQAAKLLGRKTAAINVESTAAVERLRRAGVDYAQGSAVNKMGPVMT